MALLHWLLKPFQLWNDTVLPIGRSIAVLLIGLMVVAILIQVFYRYVLSNPLPWPDEAARFCMLWMTGLIAPMAYRRGGFVAIDTLPATLPPRAAAALSLVLLAIATAVLVLAVQIGYAELTGFNAKFKTASLYLPVSLDLSEWMKVPRWWMMASLFVGVVLLLIVNIELMLRNLIALFGEEHRLKEINPPVDEIMAE